MKIPLDLPFMDTPLVNEIHFEDLLPADNAEKSLFAEVIIPLALPKNYTWYVGGNFGPSIKVGCRVEVELEK